MKLKGSVPSGPVCQAMWRSWLWSSMSATGIRAIPSFPGPPAYSTLYAQGYEYGAPGCGLACLQQVPGQDPPFLGHLNGVLLMRCTVSGLQTSQKATRVTSDSTQNVAAEGYCLAFQQTYQLGMQKGDLIQGVSTGSAPRYGMLKALDQTVDLAHCRASSVIAQPLHPPCVRPTEHDLTIGAFLWCMCSQRRIFFGAYA